MESMSMTQYGLYAMTAALVGLTILWLHEWLVNQRLERDIEHLLPLAKAGIEYSVTLQRLFDDADGFEVTEMGRDSLTAAIPFEGEAA